MSGAAASLETVLEALERMERKLEALPGPTVDVSGAAALLHCSKRQIFNRRARGEMPTPISRRPLVWRTADVLAMKE